MDAGRGASWSCEEEQSFITWLGGDENSQEQQERAHHAASRWWKRDPEGVGPVMVSLVGENGLVYR